MVGDRGRASGNYQSDCPTVIENALLDDSLPPPNARCAQGAWGIGARVLREGTSAERL